jgi:hypothetical protein
MQLLLSTVNNLKFIYSEKATKFYEIFPFPVHTVKSKGKISQSFVAFSEYMNFNVTDFMAFHALPEYCSWLDLGYSNQHMVFGMCTKLFNSFLLSKLTVSILNRKYVPI